MRRISSGTSDSLLVVFPHCEEVTVIEQLVVIPENVQGTLSGNELAKPVAFDELLGAGPQVIIWRICPFGGI